MTRALLAAFVLSLGGISAANEGEELYQRCAVCHLPDGAGIPGFFPPLKNRLDAIATTKPGRAYIAMTIIGGLIGIIEIDGTSYSGAMPAQDLSDAEIAHVLNYIVSSLGTGTSEGWQAFSEAEVAVIRQEHSESPGQAAARLRDNVPGLGSE